VTAGVWFAAIASSNSLGGRLKRTAMLALRCATPNLQWSMTGSLH